MKRTLIGGLALLLLSMLVPTAASTAGAQSDCDPNYEPCVPVASDVDCEGGEGDGPAYVAGPVTVVGEDVYDLDHDGNGTGCENGGGPAPTTPPQTTTEPPPTTTPPAAPAPPPAAPIVESPDFTG